MKWFAEVASAWGDVLAEFPPDVRALLDDVKVEASEAAAPAWGQFFFADRRLVIYRPAFDAMPDPENRAVQLRDVIRHEIEHAFGEASADHFGHAAQTQFRWTRAPQVIYTAGLRIALPAIE